MPSAQSILFWQKSAVVRHNKFRRGMSALGQKRTSAHVRGMSALPPKAEIETQSRDVRFVPIADMHNKGRRALCHKHLCLGPSCYVISVVCIYFGSASVRLRQRVSVKRVFHLSNKLRGK